MLGSIYNFSVTKIIEEFFKSKGNSPSLRSSKKLYGNDTLALDHISDLPRDHIDVDEARRKLKEQTSSSSASSTVLIAEQDFLPGHGAQHYDIFTTQAARPVPNDSSK